MRKLMVLLALCSLCLLSAAAQDFRMETRDGRQMRLAELPADRPTLLVFYDPDCGDCRQELFAMRHSSLLRQALSEGRLQVLAVYAEADEQLWRATSAELPETWTVAIARTDIHSMACYDLSAMPVMYLLDGQKKIIQEDTDLYQLTGLLK